MADKTLKIQPYKSSDTLARESQKKIVKVVIKEKSQIEPQKEVFINVDFQHTFTTEPFVEFTLVCADNRYGLEYHIQSISCKDMIICAKNELDMVRDITVMCKAKA